MHGSGKIQWRSKNTKIKILHQKETFKENTLKRNIQRKSKKRNITKKTKKRNKKTQKHKNFLSWYEILI